MYEHYNYCKYFCNLCKNIVNYCNFTYIKICFKSTPPPLFSKKRSCEKLVIVQKIFVLGIKLKLKVLISQLYFNSQLKF